MQVAFLHYDPKKDQVFRLGLFLSIAKAMVYHHALASISSAEGCILLSQ